MPELTTANSPVRLFLSEKHGRIVVNHPDYLLVACLVCGHTKSLVLHKLPGLAEVPSVLACTCEPPTLLSAQEDAYAAALQ